MRFVVVFKLIYFLFDSFYTLYLGRGDFHEYYNFFSIVFCFLFMLFSSSYKVVFLSCFLLFFNLMYLIPKFFLIYYYENFSSWLFMIFIYCLILSSGGVWFFIYFYKSKIFFSYIFEKFYLYLSILTFLTPLLVFLLVSSISFSLGDLVSRDFLGVFVKSLGFINGTYLLSFLGLLFGEWYFHKRVR